MRLKSIIIVYCLLVLLGCPDGSSPDVFDEHELEFGQSLELSEIQASITFQNLLGDSRCPTGVQCVWEGNAEILLRISAEDSYEDFSLNTTLEPIQIEYNDHILSLISVSPYPVYGEVHPSEVYSIRFSITQ